MKLWSFTQSKEKFQGYTCGQECANRPTQDGEMSNSGCTQIYKKKFNENDIFHKLFTKMTSEIVYKRSRSVELKFPTWYAIRTILRTMCTHIHRLLKHLLDLYLQYCVTDHSQFELEHVCVWCATLTPTCTQCNDVT